MKLSLGSGPLADRVGARLAAWRDDALAHRLWEKDPEIWFPDSLPDELVDRLGWLDLPQTSRALVDDLVEFAAGVRNEVDRVVLVGMGGSSLAPDVFSRTFEARGLPLDVLDTTHPAAVRSRLDSLDPARTFFVVSSKSGTTLETLSLFRAFWAAVSEAVADPGSRFCAISDPGSPLLELAAKRGFRRGFAADPNVGGRFSALTAFGLVPAALLGLDLDRLLERARHATRASHADPAGSPGLMLGAALGEAGLAGRDKLTFVSSEALEAAPDWIEQLIAESTGKEGRGLVPIVGEPALAASAYGEDRFFIALAAADDDDLAHRLGVLEGGGHPVARFDLSDAYDLGEQFQIWEIAVAVAGAVLGIHPFNQPNVELAKQLAKQAMASGSEEDEDIDEVAAASGQLAGGVDDWLATTGSGDYLGIHAYLAPDPSTKAALSALRAALARRTGLPTTFGWGPRFLHSTGQLHKGGADNGVFLQIVDRPTAEVSVPETDFTFGSLIRAQAIGDYQALVQSGRRVLRVDLGAETESNLARLRETIDRA